MKPKTVIRILENICYVASLVFFWCVDYRLALGLFLYDLNVGFALWREEL